MALRAFTCVDHDNHYVGAVSVVVADTEAAARQLLDAELAKCGLHGSELAPYSLREIDLTYPQALVLQDGDY